MEKYKIRQKELNNVVYKTAFLQFAAIIITCSIGIYLNEKGLIWEQVLLIPAYVIYCIWLVWISNKWFNKIDEL